MVRSETEHVSTRFLVLSDTHGEDLNQIPNEEVDVLIHCGDITEESKLAEFQKVIDHLREFKAPLKIVIAGNHDFTLDDSVFEKKLATIQGEPDPDLIKATYGEYGEARALFEAEDVKAAGIVFLDEGNHRFQLTNGASLRVYASPFTPSVNEWGFQFDPHDVHDWTIGDNADIVVTHGPPEGILDRTDGRRAGDKQLFAAVARTRPLMHCFGHIHASWGARDVAWRDETSENPSHFKDIDHGHSKVIETLAGIEAQKFDSEEQIQEKKARLKEHKKKGFCYAGKHPQRGEQTIFINAAIEGKDDDSQHLPWVVDLNIPQHTDHCEIGSSQSSAPAETNTQHHGKVAPNAEHKNTLGDVDRGEKRKREEGEDTYQYSIRRCF